MASNPLNFRVKRFKDLVHGREGTFIEKIEVPEQELGPNIRKGYKIKYVPDADMLTSFIDYIKLLAGVDAAKVTEEVYPANAVFEESNPHDKVGAPDEEVVVTRTVTDQSPWLDNYLDEERESVTQLEEKAGESESKSYAERAKNVNQDAQERVADASKTPRRQNRGRRDYQRNRDKKKKKSGRRNRDRRSDE